ncbi:hypothetical protein JCM10213_003517 [Rhodosporidiobolus nylandii]
MSAMQRPLATVLRPLVRPRRLPVPSSSARSASSSSAKSATPGQGAHSYLAEARRAGASTSPSSGPSAGPFALPSAADAQARAERIEASQRKWRELGVAQKAGVVATQGASGIVVLGGAALFCLVAYAVGSELFSEASPTRVFEDCVERVRADPELTSVLLPPLTFHGSSTGGRGRHRPIQHAYSADPTTGAETLFVRFWVEARSADDAEEESWMDWAKRWIGPAIWEDSHNPGAYQPVLSSEEKEAREKVEREQREREEREKRRKTWGGWIADTVSTNLSAAVGGIVGGAGGFRGQRGEEESGASLFRRQRKPKAGEFTTGEVVAELEKDRQTGHFVYKQLFVAIPDTHHPSYYRHNISTATVIPSGEQEAPRYRFWSRSKVA